MWMYTVDKIYSVDLSQTDYNSTIYPVEEC